jgi:hypothetical protein
MLDCESQCSYHDCGEGPSIERVWSGLSIMKVKFIKPEGGGQVEFLTWAGRVIDQVGFHMNSLGGHSSLLQRNTAQA